MCKSYLFFLYALNVSVYFMCLQIHTSSYLANLLIVPDVNLWRQLDENVLKPCDREISEEVKKNKEDDDVEQEKKL